MKLIIDIPTEAYNRLLEEQHLPCRLDIEYFIVHGIPLPEGHGRLIDADKLDRIMFHKAFETDSDMQKWDSGCWIRYKMFENSMKEVPTIVEPK